MRNCIDEGMLQALFDGELPPAEAAEVSAHLSACTRCAETARTVEAENLLLREGLAAELEQAIPSARLRDRLDAALAAQNIPARPTSQGWLSVVRDFIPSFRVLAYATAAAAVLLAVTAAFLYFKQGAIPPREIVKAPTVAPAVPLSTPAEVVSKPPENIVARGLPPTQRKPLRKKESEPDATSLDWQEHQYEKAIAKLNEAMKTQAPLRPSLLVEYEYNMALIDNAIATTREAARKNPKDPQTAQFVLSAYQSKVDLMNQIADVRVLER